MKPSSENIINLYEKYADVWDRGRSASRMDTKWMGWFVQNLPPFASVLDIGCGGGQPVAAHFVSLGYNVTGIDASAPLINLCRTRFPQHSWSVADMRQMDLGQQFDGLIAWDSFFHLTPEDQRGMFARFRAHARRGAMLMFTSGPDHGSAIGMFEGEELYHGSLAPVEYRALLAQNGFRVLAHMAEDPECGGHTVWLARQEGRVVVMDE